MRTPIENALRPPLGFGRAVADASQTMEVLIIKRQKKAGNLFRPFHSYDLEIYFSAICLVSASITLVKKFLNSSYSATSMYSFLILNSRVAMSLLPCFT